MNYEICDPGSIMAVSLWQPWATLMEMGVKANETRFWYTSYRGPLAIHASKKWGWEFYKLCRSGAFHRVLSTRFSLPPACGRCPKPLPLGAIVCVVDLVDCVRISKENTPDGDEREFGDYTPGRFSWKTTNLRPLREPIPWIGAQGLFKIPLSVQALCHAAGPAKSAPCGLFDSGGVK